MKSQDPKPENVRSVVRIGGDRVSRRKLRDVWYKVYPGEHIPEMSAWVVSKEMFFNYQTQLRNHHSRCGHPAYIEDCSIKEWVKWLRVPHL